MRIITKGATSQSIQFFVLDSTTGAAVPSLVYNSSGLVAYYIRNREAPVAITLATLANNNSAWSSGGFKEIHTTQSPGEYRLDVPDAAFATGVDSVSIVVFGVTGMDPVREEIQLSVIDLQNPASIFTTAMTESYAADGAAPTPAQLLFMLWSLLAESNVSGATLSAKKLDGSTVAMTFTLSDATNPVSITRAT